MAPKQKPRKRLEGVTNAITRHVILRHLPYFVILARELNFHRAAALLNVTQSGLSRRIKALEDEVGSPLFDRSSRETRLTAAGKMLYENAQIILRTLDLTLDRVNFAKNGETGTLRVGLNEGAARSSLITDALRTYRDQYPGVYLTLRPMLTEQQLTALANATLDVGFLYDLVRDRDFEARFQTHLIRNEPMVLAISADVELAHKANLTIADLAGEPLIWPSREHGPHLYDRMIAAFHASGESPRIALEVLTSEMTCSMAAAGLGMGFVGKHHHVPSSVVLREIEGFDVSLDLQMVWPRDRHLETLGHLFAVIGGGGIDRL